MTELRRRASPSALRAVVGCWCELLSPTSHRGSAGLHELNLSRGTSYNAGSRVRSMTGVVISTSSISTRNCTQAERRWLV